MESLSLRCLRQVLTWAAEQGMSIRGQLSEEQVAALERIFAGKDPWSFEQYQQLRALAHALPRLNRRTCPRC